MASPADREVQAREDVERIARAFWNAYEDLTHEYVEGLNEGAVRTWDALPLDAADLARGVVRRLLTTGVIRVGERPPTPDQMPGQISIVDEDAPAD